MKRLVIILMVAAFVLPTMAQSYGSQDHQFQSVAAPAAGFRSTSTMRGSGSAYTSNPTLESNGTASVPAASSIGPRKAPPPLSTEDQRMSAGGGQNTPLGDAVLPLMLIALAFIGITYLRRKKLQ